MVILCIITHFSGTHKLSEIISKINNYDSHVESIIMLLWIYLAAELILHWKVNKSNTRGHQGIDKPHCVQSCLELGWHHSHEDLPTEGLDTVLTFQTFSYALCRHRGDQWQITVKFTNEYRFFAVVRVSHTIRAPAVSTWGVFDGSGGGQLHSSEQAGARSQLHTLPVQLARQGHLHGFVGECWAVTWQTGSLVEIQNLLSVTGEAANDAKKGIINGKTGRNMGGV